MNSSEGGILQIAEEYFNGTARAPAASGRLGAGLGKTGAEWYAQAVLVAFVLVPLCLIFYFNIFTGELVPLENVGFYSLGILVATIQGGLISYFSWRCYQQSGELFLRWLTLGICGFTVSYGAHGAAVLVVSPGAVPLYGPASRVLLAAMLLKAIAVYDRNAAGDAPALRRRGWLIWLAVLPAFIGGVPLLGSGQLLRLALESSSLGLLLAAILVMLGRRIGEPLMRTTLAGLALLAESSLSFLLGGMWNQQWWLAHVIQAGGYLLLSYAVVRAFLTTRAFSRYQSPEQMMAQLIREVEARLRNELSLREQTERLSAILRTVVDGIVTIGADGIIDSFNPAAERIFGYSADEVIGRSVALLMPEPHGRHQAYLDRGLETGRAGFIGAGREVVGLRKDGGRFPMELVVSEIVGGTTRRFAGVVRDITERKAFQQEILTLNESLEERIRERTDELRHAQERLLDALSLTEEILWASGVGLLVYRQDGQCVMVNPAAAAILGVSLETLRTENFRNFASFQHAELRRVARQVRDSGLAQEIEIYLSVAPGRSLWLKCHLARLARQDGLHLLAVIQDVTDEHRIGEELRLAASVFHNSGEGVMITDGNGTILSVNPAFTRITGYGEAEVLGATPRLLKSDRHQDAFYAAMWSELTATGVWQGEIWNRRKNGEAFLEWLSINSIDDGSHPVNRYVAVFHDITELHLKDEHIRHLAFHDPLTNLPNRALVQDRLQHAIERARRENARLAVLFIDLDRFKLVNDSLGHDIGDRLLMEVSRRLTDCLRKSDTIARLGGDEFLVLLTDFENLGEIAEVADKVIRRVGEPMTLNGHEVRIGASIGIALYPDDGDDLTALMKGADTAMYRAKEACRNSYRFHDASMDTAANQRITLETGLHNALERREFQLFYQPKVELGDGRLIGAEALIRWNHRDRGMVPPNVFIPLAEETGLIVQIGDWVLEEACRQMAEWRDQQGLEVKVAVNVCTRQLLGPGIAGRIADLLVRYRLEASQLEIEVTESSVMSAPESAVSQLETIRAMGITIAVDDFGTGYSSLAYLKNLPVNTIKIDRSFVQQVDSDSNNSAIVLAIIGLSNALKLNNVAEGVETAAEEQLLRSAGCHSAQGYRYARPLPAEQFAAWVAARRAAALAGAGYSA